MARLIRGGTTLGRARYAVRAGQRAAVRFTLTRAGRAALRGTGPIRVQLRSAGSSQTLVLVRR